MTLQSYFFLAESRVFTIAKACGSTSTYLSTVCMVTMAMVTDGDQEFRELGDGAAGERRLLDDGRLVRNIAALFTLKDFMKHRWPKSGLRNSSESCS